MPAEDFKRSPTANRSTQIRLTREGRRGLSLSSSGSDLADKFAFSGWAVLMVGFLVAWTKAAVVAAKHIEFGGWFLRIETMIATIVSLSMAVMTVATLVWWVAVARFAPAFLAEGGPIDIGSNRTTFLPPTLVEATVLMLIATAIGAFGMVRAVGANPSVVVER